MNSYSMSRRGISSIRPRYRVLRNDYASIVLKKNVWIVSNATILSGVTIGESVVVTAGAVVTKNVLERARGRRSCPGNSDDLNRSEVAVRYVGGGTECGTGSGQ